MEFRKKNWNGILNNFITSICLILVTLLCAMIFVPAVKVSSADIQEVTKEELDEYNVYFKSAKTGVKNAYGLRKETFLNHSNKQFTNYTYDYASMNEMYLKQTTLPSSDKNSNISISSDEISPNTFTKVNSTKYSEYIPTEADYYKNNAGEMIKMFSEDIGNNDFVLLDNFNINYENQSSLFDVENLYLSFGSPDISEDNTLLYDLTVTAKLYSTHIDNNNISPIEHSLVLNEPSNFDFDGDADGSNKEPAKFWYQYFDLKELVARDGNSLYNVENPQGKYEFTFQFSRYDKNYEETDEDKVYKYSFYLLDSANYTAYPTISNADKQSDDAYYYNFTTNNPTVTYDPTKYNLNYTRTNNKSTFLVDHNITSNIVSQEYTINGNKYPKDVLTYYNGTKPFKQVYILTCASNDGKLIEYLYLSTTDFSDTLIHEETDTYAEIEALLANNNLKFEYKIIKNLTIADNTYTINTYRLNSYNHCNLGQATSVSVKDLIDTEKYTVSEASQDTLKINRNAETTALLTFEKPKISEVIDVQTSPVVYINNTSINKSETEEINENTFKYELKYADEKYILEKTFIKNIGEETTQNINLNTSTMGTFDIQDPYSDHITITYTVEKVTEGEGENTTNTNKVTSLQFSNKTSLSVKYVNCDQKALSDILEMVDNKRVPYGYTYELKLNELGVYNFEYSYVCTEMNESNTINSLSSSDGYSNSTNISTPVNYATTFVQEKDNNGSPVSSRVEKENKPLYVSVSKRFGIDPMKPTSAIINGKEFKFENGVLILNQESLQLNKEYTDGLIPVTYSLNNDQSILTARYTVGKVSEVKKSTNYISENGRILSEVVTTLSYSDKIATTSLTEDYLDLKNVIDSIEDNTIKEISYSGTTQGRDTMHIFGSLAYFNRVDSKTDSGFAKLEQIDVKENINYISDVTSLYAQKYGKNAIPNVYDEHFSGSIASLLTKDKFIYTDVTPILWNNFSTLAYNGKESLSYIYRYKNYSFANNGTVEIYGSPEISSYNKDVYCQFDGLYEVVIFYNYGTLQGKYFQVFTFIIDNSSPDIIIEAINPGEGENETTYTTLSSNSYTNKNVRISWEKPSYFKNDIFIDINKQDYSNKTQYIATYKNLNISVDKEYASLDAHIRQFTSMSTYLRKTETGSEKVYYSVIIQDTKEINETVSSDINGKYKIIVQYNSNGNSKFSEDFIIDKQPIKGLNIQPIVKQDDGSYRLSQVETFNNDQIINKDFTFRFNAKDSKANIYVYYDKIQLSAYDNYDEIITSDGKFGLTTKAHVDETTLSTGTQYVYDYDTLEIVNNSNVLLSNSSCIYLFKLRDDAGNECRYVVFYDKTQPRFLTSPEADPITSIINTTTRVIWGDYKAIKISTDTNLDNIDFNKPVSNYSKEKSSSSLEIALRYINNDSIFANEIGYQTIFNGLKIAKADNNNYYILLPITNTTIEDREYNKQFSLAGTNINEYYFFPTNPIFVDDNNTPDVSSDDSNKINLPIFDSNGKVDKSKGEKEYTVASYDISKITNFDNQLVDRQIQITYIVDPDTKETKTIYGLIGEGKFVYSVEDQLQNKTTGLVWMNLDRTQTMGFGAFDYSDTLKNVQAFTGTTEIYSASKMYISSLTSATDSIPPFTVTYKHFPYNVSLYKNHTPTSISLSTDTTGTYLVISMENTDKSSTPTFKVQLTDADNNSYPKISYPYSLESSGEETDVYAQGFSYKGNDTSRKFSPAINTTTDTNRQKVVTEEGLYIVKREYSKTEYNSATLNDPNFKNDKRIIYRVYYIDRSGIINITSSNSAASKLYDIGSNITFTLGSDYDDTENQRKISAKSIQNTLTPNGTSIGSNSNLNSNNFFTTNKVLVEFTKSYDKHNFGSFKKESLDTYEKAISSTESEQNKGMIATYLDNYLFNDRFFSETVYKVDFKLSIGQNEVIIDEANNVYSELGIKNYLKSNSKVSNTIPTINSKTTAYYMYYGTPSAYNIVINDKSGYTTETENGINPNTHPNMLTINFNINHNAPEGSFYGKYYGRENYDENAPREGQIVSNTSIPIDQEDNYALLTEYLNGKLDPMGMGNNAINNTEFGREVRLLSTNNETLIFTFSITNDPNQAKIDPNNIQIYKGGKSNSTTGKVEGGKLIFNKVNGLYSSNNCIVSPERQASSFITNIIDSTTYHAIIIFDNNLDMILDNDEKDEYGKYRLLDAMDNNDDETYHVILQYVGDVDNYKSKVNSSNQNTSNTDLYYSFHKTTFEIKIDRIKPTYNLTKLMALDKYTYNTVSTTVSQSNYMNVFNSYAPFYNFKLDETKDYVRSDIESYFFALDCRDESSFVFDNISVYDNNNSIYIRKVNKTNYKFSVTPDDYQAYYTTEYLTGHPQFTPSNSTPITSDDLQSEYKLTEGKYYKVSFELDKDPGLSASYLLNNNIFLPNSYYEIIEEDEAGNYRVYAVYIPEQESNAIVYEYQENSNISSLKEVEMFMSVGNDPYIESSGMALKFKQLSFKDNFLRANLTFETANFTHLIDIIFNPNTLNVDVINRSTQTKLQTIVSSSRDKDGFTNTDAFMKAINDTLDNYYSRINDKSDPYFSEYGYTVSIHIIDRTGVYVNNVNRLFNYEISYVVAGSTLSPKFIDNAYNFTMKLEGQKGSTYLTNIEVYKFNKTWDHRINFDNSPTPKPFNMNQNLKDPIDFTLNRGVYKFVFEDNFGRVNTFFHEFGISSSQTGGALKYTGNKVNHTDGYTYTSRAVEYSYDSSIYNVYIKFNGRNKPDESEEDELIDQIVYASNNTNYTDKDLLQHGITIITSGNTTTIRFSGVQELSKYHIKTILASTSDDYEWGDEENNKDIFVYDKTFAIYTALPKVTIRNLSGTTLPSSTKLNLTEDFELVIAWDKSIDISERINFNSRIVLTRRYNDNGIIYPTTRIVQSGEIISLAGEYEAYIINDLGTTGPTLYFNRGEGEISMYAVYSVNSDESTEKTLSPSSLVNTSADGKALFTYFVTSDYFNYKFSDGTIITPSDILDFSEDQNIAYHEILANRNKKYVDVRVNSNLSIRAEIHKMGMLESFGYPYVEYVVYSRTQNDSIYTYRYIRIVFVESTDTILGNVHVSNDGEPETNLSATSSIVTSTNSSINVEFNFADNSDRLTTVPQGNTLFLERYYNGELIEVITYTISDPLNIKTIALNLSTVGLHEFVLKDLAGRIHKFSGADKLQIYLINQILYTVNDNTPIHNQIFNSEVDIDIIFSLSGLNLYDDRSINIEIAKNGQEINIPDNNGHFTIKESGYYSVKMLANTLLANGTATQISSTYNFSIIDPSIATRSFSLSKGSGFTLAKLYKIVNKEKFDITEIYPGQLKENAEKGNYDSSNLLLWLDHKEQGNSTFEITLKYYEVISKTYKTFTFSIWINNEIPNIISSIPDGTETKDSITINYNPGLMFTQIGKGYITLNDKRIVEINEASLSQVETIAISSKGTYWMKIYTEDGNLISSYKFVKNDPVNNVTKIIIISVAIGIVVIVGLFFFLRRKGKYR